MARSNTKSVRAIVRSSRFFDPKVDLGTAMRCDSRNRRIAANGRFGGPPAGGSAHDPRAVLGGESAGPSLDHWFITDQRHQAIDAARQDRH